jgi:hypothetical protein
MSAFVYRPYVIANGPYVKHERRKGFCSPCSALFRNTLSNLSTATSMTFQYAGGNFPEMTPYLCYLQCLKTDLVIPGRPTTVGITEGTVCLCGLELRKMLYKLRKMLYELRKMIYKLHKINYKFHYMIYKLCKINYKRYLMECCT